VVKKELLVAPKLALTEVLVVLLLRALRAVEQHTVVESPSVRRYLRRVPTERTPPLPLLHHQLVTKPALSTVRAKASPRNISPRNTTPKVARGTPLEPNLNPLQHKTAQAHMDPSPLVSQLVV